MKISYVWIISICLLLAGCAKAGPDDSYSKTEIDWVDFVMLNGHFYTGLSETVVADPKAVATTAAVGRTAFKVADVVSDPGYQVQDGDAAFLPIGTELYRVPGFEPNQLIAAKNSDSIGGHRLYAEMEFAKTVQRHYAEVPKDKTVRIELHKGWDPKPYKTLWDNEKEQFIRLLDEGKDVESGTLPGQDGDFIQYYKMVFYTGGPIAYSFPIMDDGGQVYFTPMSARLVDPAIRALLQP